MFQFKFKGHTCNNRARRVSVIMLAYILHVIESAETLGDEVSHVPAILLHSGAGLGAQHQVRHTLTLCVCVQCNSVICHTVYI